MKYFPAPALAAAAAALVALPFSRPAAALLFVTAWLGAIIHADYVLRCRPAPLPRSRSRRTWIPVRRVPATPAPAATEPHRLAA